MLILGVWLALGVTTQAFAAQLERMPALISPDISSFSDAPLLLIRSTGAVVHRPRRIATVRRAFASSGHNRKDIVSFYLGSQPSSARMSSANSAAATSEQRIGGSGTDFIHAMKTDADGNFYIAGVTDSIEVDLPPALTARRARKAAWLMKLDPTGSQVRYRVLLAGSGDNRIDALAVDAFGDVYVVGSTSSVLSGFTGAAAGLEDAFAMKVDSTGALVYGVYIGGSKADYALAIAVDANGKATVAGKTSSTALPGTTSGAQSVYAGGASDCFVSRVSPQGALEWTRFLGGSGADGCHGVALDTAGNTYLAGVTDSLDLPSAAGAQSSRSGSTDAFAAKLSATGAIVYRTYLGGGAPDYASAVTVDGSGNLWVAGATAAIDFPTTPDAFQRLHRGGYDGFVTLIAADGQSILYSTLLGGSGDDAVVNCALNASGRIALAGFTSSVDLPVQSSTAGFAGTIDAFAGVLRRGASQLDVLTYIGGSGDDRAMAVQFCGTATLCVAGWTASTSSLNSPATVDYDGFLASITYSSTPPPALPSSPSPAAGATDVSRTATLAWSADAATTSYEVYFGAANPPPPAGTTSAAAFNPGTLSAGTTYFWKVVANNSDGSTSSPVWSFATIAINGHRDFNADGRLDVIWQDPVSGWAQVWYLGGAQGATITGAANLTASNPWRIVGVGDFNSDGRPDVVWQDSATGAAQAWFLGGTQGNVLTAAVVLSAGNAWRIRSIADFNGDGKPDALWQDEASGWAQIWFMSGTQGNVVTGAVNLTTRNTWRIVGAADFNHDGTLDVVWQDPVTGIVQIWYMGGAQRNVITGAVNLAGSSTLRVAAVFDLNADGQPDIVWQDPVTGASQVSFLGGAQGITITGTAVMSGPNSWRIMGPK